MSHVRYMDQSVPFWDFVQSLEQQGARPHSGPEGRKAHRHGHGRGRGGPGRRGGFGGGMGRRHRHDGNKHAALTDEDLTTSDEETPIMTPATATSERQPLLNEKSVEFEQTTDAITTDTETDDATPRKMGRGKNGGRGMGHKRGGFGPRGGMRGMGRRGGFAAHGMMPQGPHGLGPHGMGLHAFGSHGMPPMGPHFGHRGMGPQFGSHGMGPHSFGGRGRGGPFGGMRGPRRHGMGPQRNMNKAYQGPFDTYDLSEALNGYSSSSGNESDNSTKKGRKNIGRGLNKKSAKKHAGKNGVEKNKKLAEGTDFRPLADVFNTPSAFVVHIALPGAKRDDVNLAWRPKRGVLVISGNVARPADEVLLSSLKHGERKVGAFRRRVRLGGPAKPAQVEVDRIDATLEAGILRVTIPKKNRDSGFVDVEKKDLL